MAYLGCILFGLLFVVMTAQSDGTLQQRLDHTFSWIQHWAPFSYMLIALLLAAPVAMVKVMNSWPKREEPEDPMAKYRRSASTDVITED